MVMNCIEVQRLIMPFINKELDIDQLEDFVNHVNTCSNCMEELEVYYVLLSGMKQLDEDKELSDDFHQDLMNILKQSEDHILNDKILHIRKRVILIIMITLVAVVSSFRIGEIVVEDVLNKEVTESNYRMENLFYNNFYLLTNSKSGLSESILKNAPNIYVYLRETDTDGAEKMKEEYGEQIWEGVKLPTGVGLQLNIPDWTILSY